MESLRLLHCVHVTVTGWWTLQGHSHAWQAAATMNIKKAGHDGEEGRKRGESSGMGQKPSHRPLRTYLNDLPT